MILYRLEPHAGHTALMSRAAVGLPGFRSVLTNSRTAPRHEHYPCSTTFSLLLPPSTNLRTAAPPRCARPPCHPGTPSRYALGALQHGDVRYRTLFLSTPRTQIVLAPQGLSHAQASLRTSCAPPHNRGTQTLKSGRLLQAVPSLFQPQVLMFVDGVETM